MHALNIRQAIETKYLAPTNTRGARISATALAGRKLHDWDHAHDVEWNHWFAACELARSLNWPDPFDLQGGQLANGNYVWVYVTKVEKGMNYE